ncbi:hypothetical protein D5R40_32570 [Okeania hirsuta]|uniref:NACHT domain-containing protein n=1 Tax=Okeania hirsuta TaxID=1458930 RepID=A0A3N6NR91_9CYAN|nr:hypothetical protein [Okeania hirsuta]RQH19337.1 hypothetical protein D5R40_32570 [Okeania hirsuta]
MDNIINGFNKQKIGQKNEIEFWLSQMLAKIPGTGLNQKIALQWLHQDKFIIILDGLDEAKESHRSELIIKLNHLLEDLSSPVIICSRTADYEALAVNDKMKLNLNYNATIQRLNKEQNNKLS